MARQRRSTATWITPVRTRYASGTELEKMRAAVSVSDESTRLALLPAASTTSTSTPESTRSERIEHTGVVENVKTFDSSSNSPGATMPASTHLAQRPEKNGFFGSVQDGMIRIADFFVENRPASLTRHSEETTTVTGIVENPDATVYEIWRAIDIPEARSQSNGGGQENVVVPTMWDGTVYAETILQSTTTVTATGHFTETVRLGETKTVTVKEKHTETVTKHQTRTVTSRAYHTSTFINVVEAKPVTLNDTGKSISTLSNCIPRRNVRQTFVINDRN